MFYAILAKMVAKRAKMREISDVFAYLTRSLVGFSIKLSTFANKSAKEPLKIIMQFWNGSPAGTALTFRTRNRQLIALSADILTQALTIICVRLNSVGN